MTTDRHENSDSRNRVVEHQYVGCSCWPYGNRLGGLFWGMALLMIGGVWLVANVLDLEDWGDWLVPTLFVAWGAVLLFGLRMRRTSSSPRK